MPVLEATDQALPRSALRHRPIKSDADQRGSITPVAQRASRLRTPRPKKRSRSSQVVPPLALALSGGPEGAKECYALIRSCSWAWG